LVSYARFLHGVVVEEITDPSGIRWDDGRRWDLRKPRTLQSWLQTYGWLPVVDTPRPDDTATVVHDRSVQLVDEVPTEVWTARTLTEDEQDQAARITNLEERVAALEARIGVIEPTPADGDEPTFAELTGRQAGAVYAGQRFLWEDGNVWEASTGPLNSNATPDTYPSGYTQITGLPETVVPWTAGESVAVGDLRSYGGTVYRCIQAHTTLAGWEPPNVPALWVIA